MRLIAIAILIFFIAVIASAFPVGVISNRGGGLHGGVADPPPEPENTEFPYTFPFDL
jgi:hypothetical protein